MSHAPRRKRLRNRLMYAFAGFALLVAALYGFYVVLFAYLVEDRSFEGLLQQEAEAQLAHHAAHGEWRAPSLPFLQLYVEPGTLPDGLSAQLEAEPWRREFPGLEGRHYHFHSLEPAPGVAPAWLVAEVSRQLVVRPMRGGIAQWLGWSSLVVLALALSAGAWLAHRLTAPLSRLAGLVDTASPSQLPADFSTGFPDDEVGTLARGLERLIRRVEDFVTRERAFTRDASHELRTPLAVIRSACERLGAREDLDDGIRAQVEHVRQSAQQLEQTVTTLLALAREDANAEPAVEVALLPLVERVVVDHSQPASSDVEVRIDVSNLLCTRVPEGVLRIVLANLIGNALTHTRAGVVEIRADGDWLRISNPSRAVPADAFQPFVKGADSGGYGLGLGIAQRLCERHGIGLRFDSDGGTVVASVALPMRTP
ncbi:sensor histidine kinase [Luteimonas terrae]|uniref:histidine kinase n=1 Tax=Luteimonas terrae TaxID=1530191 RepID=A0A4R5U892_9GAMM|nr:HAMP domain-containing sensor histidine kinase [Luteimonas terrae]TDK30701.1 HAMP domain-containing histidine kinase [Luteimonas terrae]